MEIKKTCDRCGSNYFIERKNRKKVFVRVRGSSRCLNFCQPCEESIVNSITSIRFRFERGKYTRPGIKERRELILDLIRRMSGKRIIELHNKFEELYHKMNYKSFGNDIIALEKRNLIYTLKQSGGTQGTKKYVYHKEDIKWEKVDVKLKQQKEQSVNTGPLFMECV